MYTAKLMEAFGPFCGQGGYATTRGVAMSNSPRKAIRIATQRLREDQNRQGDPRTGICGGGVPIMDTVELLKDGKLILDSGFSKLRIW